MHCIERLLTMLRVEVHEIGRTGLPRYLTRWVLAGRRGPDGTRRNGPGPKLFLHWIHRSDAEPYLHNHPWPFWSLILWGGYWERTPGYTVISMNGERIPSQAKQWYGPGRLLRRPADWRHRVEVPAGRTCWTLVWTGAKVQSWGFFCASGFVPWRQHAANEAVGLTGCGD